jgi:hypothetical protein
MRVISSGGFSGVIIAQVYTKPKGARVKGCICCWGYHRFQDLVAIFLDYGLKAYQRGELEVSLSERVVDYQITAKE